MDKKQLDDLIRKIAGGDKKAFEKLYGLMKTDVFSFAFSICNNWQIAKDALQDVFIKINRYAHTYKPNSNPKAWILTLTKHTVLNILRKENRCVPREEIENNTEYDQTTKVENHLLIEQLLESLNETERQIVTLHALSGLKHSEISEILNKPYGTVLWTYSNAIKKLKKNSSNFPT